MTIDIGVPPADHGDVDDIVRAKEARRVRQEAAEFGVDLALLEANLARTPAARLAANAALVRLAERARSQTLSPAERERLARHEMIEEIRAYGFDEVIARYEAMTPDRP